MHGTCAPDSPKKSDLKDSAALQKQGAADAEQRRDDGLGLSPFPGEKLRELWNAVCVSLSPVRGINGSRARSLRARWQEHPDLGWWEDYFRKIAASDFLTGRVKDWKAGFDWCLKAANVDKVLEGQYDNHRAGGASKELDLNSEHHRYDADYWMRLPGQG